MIYEARPSVKINYVLAGACLLLSLLGFTAAGIIPSASTRDHGAYPLVGWIIVAACFAAAFVFLRRAFGGSGRGADRRAGRLCAALLAGTGAMGSDRRSASAAHGGPAHRPLRACRWRAQ